MTARLLLCACLIATTPAGAADDLPKVLWRAPHNRTTQDWVCGPQGCDSAPAAPFQFVKEDSGGTNPKVSVRDAKGRSWSVKFGPEVIPECFASRFVSALGYFTQTTYFLERGTIQGTGRLRRAHRVVHRDGSFRKARFELRGQSDLEYLEGRLWSWADNPFNGTRELAGLKIVMMLLSNWDAKDARDGPDESNNNIFRGPGNSGPVLLYLVSDWGASLGRWGAAHRRDRSDCSGFARDTPQFITAVKGDEVKFGYWGKRAEDIKDGISIADVAWLVPHLRQVTGSEIRAGLKASGATEREATCWASSLENRMRQLEALVP